MTSEGQDGPPVHAAVRHLAAMVGVWKGQGAGEYPTIESFEYLEEVTIGHVGKPFLAYGQKTRDATTGLPLHAESGYFRPVGIDRMELTLAQPSGIVEIDEGTVAATDSGLEIVLSSLDVLTTTSAKEVTSVRRVIHVEGDALRYTVEMGAVGQPHQHHLAATLNRVS